MSAPPQMLIPRSPSPPGGYVDTWRRRGAGTSSHGLGSDAVGALHGAMCWSTGSVLVDGSVGAAAGYFVAPTSAQKLRYAIGGALATGLAGTFGLVATLAYGAYKRGR